jgi:hypothetical protein
MLYPTIGDMDLEAAIRDFDRERLEDEPSIEKFPELRGHRDLLRAERRAFTETSGLDAAAAAFWYSWVFFVSRRINSRHLARHDLLPARTACTYIYFPAGADGVTVADNRDDVPHHVSAREVASYRPDVLLQAGPVGWMQGRVSAACLLDDEPACLFPANPLEYDLMPSSALENINDMIEFGVRYREFYGPGNMIWVDRKLNAVAVEKTNCLVAFRRPTVNGAVGVTACAYLDDALNAQQAAGDRRAMAIKSETKDTSPDFLYHVGSRERYRRMIELVNAEASRPGGATLWGAFEVVADHAVPFPARICLAGEKNLPDKEPHANWTMSEYAAVIAGARKRCLYRSLHDLKVPRPIYEYVPRLMLGPGVDMRPEWRDDVDAGRCTMDDPVSAVDVRRTGGRSRRPGILNFE